MDKATREFYDLDPEGYSNATVGNDVGDLRRRFLAHLGHGARILDLGCGSGRDTAAFGEAGCDVVPVDGSVGMCRIATANTGIPVRNIDILGLDYVSEFDGVWASASLLHLRPDEIPVAMGLIRVSLRDGGILFASFKHGGFAGYRDGRWYTDMDEPSLSAIAGAAGFEVLDIWTAEDAGGRLWTSSILRK